MSQSNPAVSVPNNCDKNTISKSFGTTGKLTSKKKRLFYLDFIRSLSVIIIVLTHFNNPYFTQGGWIISQYPFNIYLGNLGVSLFLIISATALSINYGKHLDLRVFYKKRFLGIYPMFWIAWLIGSVAFYVLHGRPIGNGAPPLSFLFTLFAMDGMAANFGFPTMYLLGEWFLGFIVMFYLIFPLLLLGVQRHPWVTVLVGIAFYCLAEYWVLIEPRPYPGGILLPLRILELLFGMCLAQYWKRFPWWTLIVAGGVLAASSYMSWIPEDIAVPLVGMSAFVILAVAATYLDYDAIRVPINWISKYSYAIFLVHHVIIMSMFALAPIVEYSYGKKLVAFGLACALSAIFGYALFHVHRLVMKGVYRLLALKKH